MAAINPRVGDDWVWLWKETTWGQAIAAGQAFDRLDCEFSQPDEGIIQHRPNRARQTRGLEIDNVRHDKRGTAPLFSMACPVKRLDAAKWMYLAFQNVSEAAGTPFLKTYTWMTTQPDFQSDAGIVFALASKGLQDASSGIQIGDALCKRVVFKCSRDANDGLLMVNADWIARGPAAPTYNSTGVITEIAQTFYHFDSINAVLIEGMAAYPSDVEIEFVLDIVPYSIAGGATATQFLTYVIRDYKALMKIKCLWTTDAFATFNKLAPRSDNDSAPIEAAVVLQWGSAAAEGYLGFSGNTIVLPSSRIVDGSPREIQFDLECVRNVTGALEPITGYCADAVDRIW